MECWCVGGLVNRHQDQAPDNSWIKLHLTSHSPHDENDGENDGENNVENDAENDNQNYTFLSKDKKSKIRSKF